MVDQWIHKQNGDEIVAVSTRRARSASFSFEEILSVLLNVWSVASMHVRFYSTIILSCEILKFFQLIVVKSVESFVCVTIYFMKLES